MTWALVSGCSRRKEASQQAARRGGANAEAAASEQHHAAAALQSLEPFGDRRLGEVQRVSGAMDTRGFDSGHEGDKTTGGQRVRVVGHSGFRAPAIPELTRQPLAEMTGPDDWGASSSRPFRLPAAVRIATVSQAVSRSP